MVKKKMYKRIQELKKKGYGKLEIGRKLRLDPATVRKYYNMSGDEYREYQLERCSLPAIDSNSLQTCQSLLQ